MPSETSGRTPYAPLMDVPLTAANAWEEATHECGGCGQLLRLGTDRNWPLHGCHKGGKPLSKGVVTVYPTEDEMRCGPSHFDAATWEYLQEVVVPTRKPLPEPPLPIDGP